MLRGLEPDDRAVGVPGGRPVRVEAVYRIKPSIINEIALRDGVELCLDRGGCQFVPGLPREQWLLTLATSVLGGLIAGFAAYPRKEGERIAWAWVLLLSPLWVMLFGVFGIAPVVTRTSDLLPLVRNGMGFVGGMVGAYLIAQTIVGRKLAEENDK